MNKKFIYIALVLIGSLGVVSCDEEDDTTFVSPNYLVGKWNLAQVGTLNSQNVLVYQNVDNSNCAADSYTFGADYNFTASDFTYDGTTCTEDAGTGTYEIIPGNLVLEFADEIATDTLPGETRTMTLRSLSDVSLELINSNQAGAITFYKYSKGL